MANNEYINKVEYGNETLIDITSTTAEDGDVIEGKSFFLKSGAPATGTLGDATISTHGLMSTIDKTKLDSIDMSTKVDKTAILGAGISASTYTTSFGGAFTVTTTTDASHTVPYAKATPTGVINKHKRYRVTINDTEYVLESGIWYLSNKYYNYLGDISKVYEHPEYIPGGNDATLPFLITFDRDSNSSIEVYTTTAGTYTIKIETITDTLTKLPVELIYGSAYAPILQLDTDYSTFNGYSIGVNALQSKRATIGIGHGNLLKSDFTLAVGTAQEVGGDNSCSIGFNNTIQANYGFIAGAYNQIDSTSNYASTFGLMNRIYDHSANASTFGARNTILPYSTDAHAFGYWNINDGEKSTTLGYSNSAFSDCTLAMGSATTASGKCQITLGALNVIDATTSWVASTNYKVGDKVYKNNRWYECITANSDATFTSSKWTRCRSKFLEILGNGDIDANPIVRSNARATDWAGNMYIKGDVYVNCNADSSGGNKLICATDYATTSAAGLMSSTDKTKLDGIDMTTKIDKVTNATTGNFPMLDSSGNILDSGYTYYDYLTMAKSVIVIPSNASTAQSDIPAGYYLQFRNTLYKITADITSGAMLGPNVLGSVPTNGIVNDLINTIDTKTATMTGATASAAGTKGTVPAPAAGDQDKYLKGDGTWNKLEAIEPYETINTPATIQSFNDGVIDVPMEITVGIEPVQDLHGYDYPWVGGAGKNLFNPATITDDYYIHRNTGNMTSNSDWCVTDYIPVTPGQTIYIGKDYGSASSAGTCFFNENKVILGVEGIGESTLANNNGVLTIPEGAYFMRHSINFSNGKNPNWQTTIYIINNSDTHEWSPYANICPITGYEGANVYHTGEWIDFSQSKYNTGEGYESGKYLKNDGTTDTSSNACITAYIPIQPNTYCRIYHLAVQNPSYCFYNENKEFISGQRYNNISNHYFTTPSNCAYIRMTWYTNNNRHMLYISYLNETITFPDPPGTVYGGTLKVNKDGTGVLTVTNEVVTLDNTASFTLASTGFYASDIFPSGYTGLTSVSSPIMKCNKYYEINAISNSSQMANAQNGTYCNQTGYKRRLWIKDTRYETAEEFVASLENEPIQIVYPLKTPVTYTLTAEQVGKILSLNNINNIWCDAGMINEITYAKQNIGLITTEDKVKLDNIPTVTSSDNGKILRVINGSWAAVLLSNAEEVSF